METMKNLLSQVSSIIQQYEKVAELTGENFNVFKILGVETKEVKTHSAFIAELLNPQGSHGQGDVFLKLFVEQLKYSFKKNIYEKRLNILNVFDTSIAEVLKEEYIGQKTEAGGGRIDIVIKDAKNQLVIENKIYAKDEEKQLMSPL